MSDEDLARLLEAVREEEREACAKLAEDEGKGYPGGAGWRAASNIAAAIRARGSK